MSVSTLPPTAHEDQAPNDSTSAMRELLSLWDLREVSGDRLSGSSPRAAKGRTFGGQLVSQALAAAARTVEHDRLPHSLYAQFLRAGDCLSPIDFDVERVRDGGSYASRRVLATQNEIDLATVSTSFHRSEEWASHQVRAPAAPRPETVRHRPLPYPALGVVTEAFELRYLDAVRRGARSMWLRTTAPLPPEQLVHRLTAAYICDLWLLDVVLDAHGRRWDDRSLRATSLDLAIWFHRPVRMDNWVFYDAESPTSGEGRGFVSGRMYSADGELLLSVAQEASVRSRRNVVARTDR
jgi:acyl-CoA thioesterase II